MINSISMNDICGLAMNPEDFSHTESIHPVVVALKITFQTDQGLLKDVTSSRRERYWGEWKSCQAAKASKIREVCGKYRDVLTPSDEFARQKRSELDLEK